MKIISCLKIKQHEVIKSWRIPEAELAKFLLSENLPQELKLKIENLEIGKTTETEGYSDYYAFKRIS